MDDISSHRHLICAVIARALMDCFRPPITKQLDTETASAMTFLFSRDVDIWLEFIDIDPDAFRSQLHNIMWNEDQNIRAVDKRAFRANYKLWNQRNVATQLENHNV